MTSSRLNEVTLAFPGDLNTLTGGYRYDKRIVEGLRKPSTAYSSWKVSLLSLEGDYPFPNDEQLSNAAQQLHKIPDGTLVVIDGLAYSVMAHLLEQHVHRLTFIALIHHPLALETGLSREQSQQLQEMETRALEHARHVITTSQLTASSLKQYNVPEHRISAILPGTDQAPLAKGCDRDTTNLLCVATLTQRKGHHVLINALSTLQQLPWHLSCVGSTERDKLTHLSLLEQCRQLKLLDRVSWHGEVDDTLLEQHYQQADVFVLASFHEGYGMVLSEAIARGLPIIACDAGAVRQTVPEGAGLLIPAGDSQALANALSLFMQDSQLRLTLRRAAESARLQLRSWDQATREFAAVLSRVRADEI